MPAYDYECPKCGIIEIRHSIKDPPKGKCPQCGGDIIRLISGGGGFIIGSKQMNQYNDVKAAKAWRDKDGNLHPVRPSDGRSSSPTAPNKKTRSDEEIKAMKKHDALKRKKQRNQASYQKYVDEVKRKKRQ